MAELGLFRCQETISKILFSFPNPICLLLTALGNLVVVVLSVLALFSSLSEKPSAPLRLWVSVYALHSLVRVFYLALLNHSARGRRIHDAAVNDYDQASQSFPESNKSDVAGASFWKVHNGDRIMKRLELVNDIISTVWWFIGFYWIASDFLSVLQNPRLYWTADGHSLEQDSPRLYWLTMSFLVCNASFLTYWISAFIACLVLFGCLPNLAIAVRKGAPKYRQDNSSTTLANDIKQGGLFTAEPEDFSQVMSDEETGEGSNVAKVKKMSVGGEEE